MVGGLGAILAAQLSLAPLAREAPSAPHAAASQQTLLQPTIPRDEASLGLCAVAGPDLPFGLNNPIGGDIERTREASQMPANRCEPSRQSSPAPLILLQASSSCQLCSRPIGAYRMLNALLPSTAEIGNSAAAESQGAQANSLQSTVGKAYGRTQPALSKDGDKCVAFTAL